MGEVKGAKGRAPRLVWKGPGRSRRGKPTKAWVFTLHLVLVAGCSVLTFWFFSRGNVVAGCVASVAWLVAFAVTAGDDVRLPAVRWFFWRGRTFPYFARAKTGAGKTREE